MSTPLDAVYNRCRPVPPWNGSSSASRRRRVTTRCSKGYKRDAGSGKGEAGRAVVLAAAILLVPAVLFSQQPPPSAPITAQAPPPAPTTPAHPEVVNLTLKGVKSVKQSELLSNIYT